MCSKKKVINKMQIRQHVNMWLNNIFQLSSLRSFLFVVFLCSNCYKILNILCPFWNWIPQKIGFHVVLFFVPWTIVTFLSHFLVSMDLHLFQGIFNGLFYIWKNDPEWLIISWIWWRINQFQILYSYECRFLITNI